jgi:hypothetical protein
MNNRLLYLLLLLFSALTQDLLGQASTVYDTTIVYTDGRVMRVRIDGSDTTVVARIPEVVVKAPPVFADDEEYRQYMRYKRYAMEVLPYAIEGIRLYREYQRETDDMKKGEAKKYAKHIQKDVREDFTDPLKNLSRTQGKILVKMIENHLHTPMYDVLQDVRGGFTATKWQTIGRLYGYDLKEGYIPGKDKILDMILNDFELNIE